MKKEKNHRVFFCTKTLLSASSAIGFLIILCLVLAAQEVVGKTVDLNINRTEFILDGNLTEQLPLDALNSAQSLTNISFGEETHIRKIRSPSFGTRQQCTVSRDKLRNLKNEINNALKNAAGTSSSEIGCTSDSTNSDNCVELLKSIQCGVNQMNVGYILAVAKKASSDEVLKWKNMYEQLSEKYERETDNLNKSLSQEYQRDLSGLKTQLQNLKSDLKKSQDDVKIKTRGFCISEIDSGKIDSAISLYKSLDDSDKAKLSEIIKAVYIGYGKLDQVVNIVNFIRKLPYCEQYDVAYPVLIELHKSNDQFYSPKTLYIIWAMEDSGCASKGFFKSLKIRELKADLITSLASNIRNNNYQQIVEFAKNYGSAIRDNVAELVKEAYANSLSNAETLLKFMRDLNWISSEIAGLNSLFDQMQRNGHKKSYQLLMLAYRTKKLMEMPDYPNVDQEYKDMAENLKWKLPQNVLNLIWFGTFCTIKNKHHNEYLYAEGDSYKFGDYRQVLSWMPKNYPGPNLGADWDFVPYNNGEKFYIKNSHYNNEYMISKTSNTYDTERRRIYTTYGTWQQSAYRIEPVINGHYFRIYNIHHGEYLYADGHWWHSRDSPRRNVFTWRGGAMGSDHLEECKWKINCERSRNAAAIGFIFGG
jgi:hypothetical protein